MAEGDATIHATGALLAQVVLGAVDSLEVEPAHRPARSHGEGHAVPVAGIRRGADERQRLQPPALGERASPLRQEPVEERILTVLGQIDDAGPRIDGGRFVTEAAEPGQWTGGAGTRALAGTSNTQPWALPTAGALRLVSSQLSQLPHDVGPPAQFTAVPERLR